MLSSTYPPWSEQHLSNRCAQQKQFTQIHYFCGQTAAKERMWKLWTAHIKQKKQCNLTVVGLNNNRVVYITSSKFSEPKRLVQRLKKVEGKYIQEEQPN